MVTSKPLKRKILCKAFSATTISSCMSLEERCSVPAPGLACVCTGEVRVLSLPQPSRESCLVASWRHNSSV